MRLGIRLLTAFLLAPAVAVAGSAAAVRYDHTVDFSSFATYDWGAGTPAGDVEAQRRLLDVLERRLATKGLARTAHSPDLRVAVHVLVDKHTLEELDEPAQWEFWTGVNSVRARDLGAGTLVVDLRSTESGKLVWRGLASATVSEFPDENVKKIEKIVRRVLKGFPPDRP